MTTTKMKTAEEWMTEMNGDASAMYCSVEEIRAIQLDARNAALEEAAKVTKEITEAYRNKMAQLFGHAHNCDCSDCYIIREAEQWLAARKETTK